MFYRILGIIWMLAGVMWFIRPEAFRNRLKNKMNRKMRRVVFVFLFVLGIVLAGNIVKVHGILPKIVGLVGMIIAIKAVMLLTSKTSETFFSWWTDKPLSFFRLWSAAMVVVGLMLIFFRGTF